MSQVKLLVKVLGLVKGDINATDEGNNTALIVAIKNGLLDVAKALILMGADLTISDNSGKTALDWAYIHNQWDIVESIMLRDSEIPISSISKNQKTDSNDKKGLSLVWAVANGQKDMAKQLINEGVSLDKQEPRNGYTALMWAIASCQNSIAKILIEKGVDLNKRDNSGRTALDWAAAFDRTVIIKLIKEAQG